MKVVLIVGLLLTSCFQSSFVFGEEYTGRESNSITQSDYIYRVKIPDGPIIAGSSMPIYDVVVDNMYYDPPRTSRTTYYFISYDVENNEIEIKEPHEGITTYKLSPSRQVAVELYIYDLSKRKILLTLDNYNGLLVKDPQVPQKSQKTQGKWWNGWKRK